MKFEIEEANSEGVMNVHRESMHDDDFTSQLLQAVVVIFPNLYSFNGNGSLILLALSQHDIELAWGKRSEDYVFIFDWSPCA